jgi:hypothetical protein
MYFELTREIVERSPRFLARVLRLIWQDQAPAQVIPLPRREIERLAA